MGLQLNSGSFQPFVIVVIVIAVLAIAAIIIYAVIDNARKKNKKNKDEQTDAPEEAAAAAAAAAKTEKKSAENKQSAAKEQSDNKEQKETAPTAEAETAEDDDEEEEGTGMVVETKSQGSGDDKEKVAPKSYHISKRKSDGMWQIKLAGGQKAIKLFKTQQEAIDYCKVLAENQDANVTVHKKDGSFRKQNY